MRALLVLAVAAASAMAHPAYNIAADKRGNLFFLDWPQKRVMKVTPEGKMTEFASLRGVASDTDPHALTFDAKGNLLVAATYKSRFWTISPTAKIVERKPPALLAGDDILNLAATPAGDLFLVAATRVVHKNGTVRRTRYRVLSIPRQGKPRVVFETNSGTLYVGSLVATKDGTVYLTHDNALYKVSAGSQRVLAKEFRTPYGLCEDKRGNLVVAEFDGNRIQRVTPGGKTTLITAAVDSPYAVCLAPGGSFWVAEYGRGMHRIRLLDASGKIKTVATLKTR
ncbi:MAG: hypothetical protein O7E54_02750 [Planctomycetota bacterium]|nr:hypothetical protein [Planctomycetota bacterium]